MSEVSKSKKENDNSIKKTDRNGKTYRFYGWENADVKDKNGFTPCDYYDILSTIWCADTCAPRLRDKWNPDNKTLGQCSITAFLIQDLFGGAVYGIPREGGNYHCFNVVDNHMFDLTSEQFGDTVLDYSSAVLQTRENHFSKEEKRLRYENLKAELIKKLAQTNPIKE